MSSEVHTPKVKKWMVLSEMQSALVFINRVKREGGIRDKLGRPGGTPFRPHVPYSGAWLLSHRS
jgi:hypothetical protein